MDCEHSAAEAVDGSANRWCPDCGALGIACSDENDDPAYQWEGPRLIVRSVGMAPSSAAPDGYTIELRDDGFAWHRRLPSGVRVCGFAKKSEADAIADAHADVAAREANAPCVAAVKHALGSWDAPDSAKLRGEIYDLLERWSYR